GSSDLSGCLRSFFTCAPSMRKHPLSQYRSWHGIAHFVVTPRHERPQGRKMADLSSATLEGDTALQTFLNRPAFIVFHDAGLVGAEGWHSRDQRTSGELILGGCSFCVLSGTSTDFK